MLRQKIENVLIKQKKRSQFYKKMCSYKLYIDYLTIKRRIQDN